MKMFLHKILQRDVITLEMENKITQPYGYTLNLLWQ